MQRKFGTIWDPSHKVRGRRIIPSFRGVSTPAYVWIKDETVSQELPAATNGGATYSIKETLPGGLTFTPTTRTIFGTHGTTQAVANYTLVTTDADKVALRFSIRIDDATILISSPSVAEGAGGAMAACTLTEAASQATLVLTPLTIDESDTRTADMVTATAVNNTTYAGNKRVTVPTTTLASPRRRPSR